MIETFGLSDVGCVRELNEDSFCIYGFDEGKNKGFCILADGMGGHNAGEVASQNTVKFIAEDMQELMENGDTEIPKKLDAAISKANANIYKMSTENIIHRGMGTTAVVLFASDDICYIANVGDSRAYAIRGKEIMQITTDHSMVAELLRSGSITKEEARVHPQKNIITRAVGTDAKVKTDIFEYNYSVGDTVIMCSDGLCSLVTDEDIYKVVKDEKEPEKVVRKLVDAAKEKGGIDNITVICMRFV